MVLLLFILMLFALISFYVVRNHDYWAKRNVRHEPPIPLFGNHLQNQMGVKSITEVGVEFYNKYPEEKVVGYYRGTVPELIVKDLDIIKQILSVDFPYFYVRGLGRNTKKEKVFGTLFHEEGDKWRLLRQRLTPAFTTAKLKAMFPLIVQCANALQKVVTDISNRGEAYDARELMARFTTQFIGACGFGIEMDSINNEHSQFRALGKLMLARRLRNRILWPFWELFPEFRSFIKIDNDDVEQAVRVIVDQIKQQRNYKPIGRHDFMDLLLELETKGKIFGESIERVNSDGTPVPVEMDMDLTCQVAQVFIFFAAGFETSSSSTSYTLHMLAYHQDIQRKVQEEIDSVMERYNELCYEAVCEMTYLDMAYKEAMRIFPPVGTLHRVCTKKYKLPGLGITIDPGVRILIPVQAIHMDEKYYDNPAEFRPERFSAEEKKKRPPFSYLPFGEGPRICIGSRLGHMQSLAGLAAVLHKFSVEPAETSKRIPAVNHASNIVQSIEGGLPLNFILRTNDRSL